MWEPFSEPRLLVDRIAAGDSGSHIQSDRRRDAASYIRNIDVGRPQTGDRRVLNSRSTLGESLPPAKPSTTAIAALLHSPFCSVDSPK